MDSQEVKKLFKKHHQEYNWPEFVVLSHGVSVLTVFLRGASQARGLPQRPPTCVCRLGTTRRQSGRGSSGKARPPRLGLRIFEVVARCLRDAVL